MNDVQSLSSVAYARGANAKKAAGAAVHTANTTSSHPARATGTNDDANVASCDVVRFSPPFIINA